MALCISLGLENTMAPGGSTCHSDQDVPSGSMALTLMATGCDPDLGHVCGLLATWTTDINIDLGCGRTTDSDMILRNNPDPDVIMVPGVSADHTGQHGPHSSMTLEQQDGPKWQPGPLASAWSSIVSGATEINTDSGCGRATVDSLGPQFSLAWQ